MTTHIISRNGSKMQLNGDILSGETFAEKEYIKKYMDGKWVADRKAWRVDVSKVAKLLATVGAAVRIDTDPAPVASGLSDAIIPANISRDELYRRWNRADSDL